MLVLFRNYQKKLLINTASLKANAYARREKNISLAPFKGGISFLTIYIGRKGAGK